MADIEKVIKGLEEISDHFFDIYRNDTDSYKCAKAQEYSDVAIDAIAMLKEYAVIKETMSKEIHETAKMFRRTAGDNEIPLKW